jgi:hypothetical protein
VKIPMAHETGNKAVKNHPYTKLIRPILAGAVQKGLLASGPSAEEVPETAHILQTKKKTSPKPRMARFYFFFERVSNREKSLPAKKPRRPPCRSQGNDTRLRTRFLYQGLVYDDLSQANFKKMRAISDDNRVDQCWAVNGQLRFRLKDSQLIMQLNSIHDSSEDILKQQKQQK